MVWFQCEDCGDNLKKPKLPNHFRSCSASKLSCIDCGEIFGQATVERHTQCITEQEKYGPKGQVKATNGTATKPKNGLKPKPEVDINVGLSDRPPWFCSLCNTKATSKQTLLLHADGKKHRAKARAHHFANQKPNDTPEANMSSVNDTEKNVAEAKGSGEQTDEKLSELTASNGFGVESNDLESNKKRKLNASEKDSSLVSGESPHVYESKADETKKSKKSKHSALQGDAKPDPAPAQDSGMKKIKWKKLIISTLKSNPDGRLKFKELKKLVVQSLKESGYTTDKNQAYEMLQEKVNSSSRFVTEGKYITLASTS